MSAEMLKISHRTSATRLDVTGLPIQSIKTAEIDATSPPARKRRPTSKGIGACDIIVMHLSTGEFNGAQGRRTTRGSCRARARDRRDMRYYCSRRCIVKRRTMMETRKTAQLGRERARVVKSVINPAEPVDKTKYSGFPSIATSTDLIVSIYR